MTPTLAQAWDSGRNHFHALRLFAAWLVILSHAYAITGRGNDEPFAHLTGAKAAGAVAVDIFFVISGFLVAASVQRHAWRHFLLARALRIYPALIVCILLTVFVLGPALTTSAGYWSDARTWHYLWGNATLWRAEFWLPGVFEGLPRDAVNGSLWTLPIEVRLYLALLVAAAFGMLHRWRYLVAWALAMCGAAVYALRAAPLPEHIAYLAWACAFFITGTLLWVWRDRVRLSWWVFAALLALAAALRGSTAFAVAYFAAVAYGTFCIAFRARLPAIRHTDLSYGVYLYGWPMQQLALMAGATTVVANTALATVLALGCAAVSWFLVERPALAWVRARAVRTASA